MAKMDALSIAFIFIGFAVIDVVVNAIWYIVDPFHEREMRSLIFSFALNATSDQSILNHLNQIGTLLFEIENYINRYIVLLLVLLAAIFLVLLDIDEQLRRKGQS